MVAVIAEVLGEDHRLLKNLGLMAPSWPPGSKHVAVDPGPDGMNARHDRYSRGMTDRSCAVGVGEVDRASGKPLKVGSLHSGMIIERGNVVVQIIDCDEEHMGFSVGRESSQRQENEERKQGAHG